MYLKSLKLKNFRNLKLLDLELNPEFNFIFGSNAQGKTNIIESIHYLAMLKSFRSTCRDDLIKNQSEFTSIAAVFQKQDLMKNLVGMICLLMNT